MPNEITEAEVLRMLAADGATTASPAAPPRPRAPDPGRPPAEGIQAFREPHSQWPMKCLFCGQALEQPHTGRRRKFCSDRCRMRSARARSHLYRRRLTGRLAELLDLRARIEAEIKAEQAQLGGNPDA